jgi:hypothetical protein
VALFVLFFGPPEGGRIAQAFGGDGDPDEEALILPEDIEADADPEDAGADPEDAGAELVIDPDDAPEADPEEEGYLNVSNGTARCLWNRTFGGAGTA